MFCRHFLSTRILKLAAHPGVCVPCQVAHSEHPDVSAAANGSEELQPQGSQLCLGAMDMDET